MPRISNNFVVSVGALPSGVPAPGNWAIASASATDTLVNLTPQVTQPATGNAFGASNSFYSQWAGAVFVESLGASGSLLLGPDGGHDTYDGNTVIRYDIASRALSVFKQTGTTVTGNAGAGTGHFSSNGEYPDGSPIAPHSYQSISVLPSKGVAGALVMTQTYQSTDDPNSRTAVSHFLDLSTKAWSRGPTFPGSTHPACEVHPLTGEVWHRAEATVALCKMSADGSTITTYPANNYAINTNWRAAIDTLRNLFIHVHRDGTPMRINDLDAPNTMATQITKAFAGGDSASLMYAAEYDKLIAFSHAASTKTFYTLTPGAGKTGYAAPAWVAETPAGPTPPANGDGSPMSKWRWIPALKSFIGVPNRSAPCYICRPSWAI